MIPKSSSFRKRDSSIFPELCTVKNRGISGCSFEKADTILGNIPVPYDTFVPILTFVNRPASLRTSLVSLNWPSMESAYARSCSPAGVISDSMADSGLSHVHIFCCFCYAPKSAYF